MSPLRIDGVVGIGVSDSASACPPRRPAAITPATVPAIDKLSFRKRRLSKKRSSQPRLHHTIRLCSYSSEDPLPYEEWPVILFLRCDECPLLEFSQRLLDLLFCVHHEWTVPRNRFMQRLPRHQQEANRGVIRGYLYIIAVAQHHEFWMSNLRCVFVFTTGKFRLTLEYICKRRMPPLDRLAK